MASRSLGTLTVDLLAKTGAFEAGMDRAARTADKRMKEMERRAYQFGNAIGKGLRVAAGAAAVAFGALAVAVGRSIENADKLDEMSQKLGISAEQLSKWGYAAKLSGTDLEGLSRAIPIFSKNLAAAMDPGSRQANLFTQLGIDIKDAEGNLRSVESLIPDVANVFKTLDNQTTETALALQLFGRSGAELLEFLNRGGDGIDALGRELSDLGGVIDNETAAAAAAFKDELDRLRETGGGLATQIAAGLLPALTEAARDLRELVKEGNLAQNMVTLLSSALSFGVGAIEAYNSAVRVTSAAMTTLVEAGRGYAEAVTNIWQPWSDGTIAGGIDKARVALGNFNALAAKPASSPFANVQSSASTGSNAGDGGLQARLNSFLANPSGRSAKKGGKSDAEREAESLQKAYDSLMESMKERIALFNTEGEAAKVAYDLEFGSLSALTEAQKENVLTLAQQYDQMVKVREEGEARAKMAKEETDRINEGLAAGKELVADLQFELELMRMTNAERAVAIQLRGLEAEAVAEYGDQIVALNQKIEEAIKADEFWQDFQSGMADAFYDFATGAKSAEDALGDFLDAIYSSSVKAAAEYFSETIANMFKGMGGSGSEGGGGWAALIGAIFGGGKAGGGWASPNSIYEVNERGLEMASVNGRDYLMTGNKAVHITPNHGLGGGGGITQQFYTMGRETRETSERKALVAGREAQRALSRTG